MSDRRKTSKSIKALTALSVALILLDVIAAGYFIIRGIKRDREASQEEVVMPETESSTTSTTAEETTEPTTEPKDEIDTIIEGMSLHEKVCQMFIVRPEELTNGSDVTGVSTATENSLSE